MTAKRPPRLIRFHHANGDTFTRTPAQLAHDNGTSIAGAMALVAEWLAAGDLARRPDGGLDVIRYRPPKRNPPGTKTVAPSIALLTPNAIADPAIRARAR